MFFALTGLIAGGTLIYAGIKGNSETINGTPIWQAPWLLIVAPFIGASISQQNQVGTTTDATGNAAPVSQVTTTTQETPVQTVRNGIGSLQKRLIST